MGCRRVAVTTFCLIPCLALAQGGPPLFTDDPDTPGDGNFEINLATTLEKTPSSSLLQLPYLDVNYGVGERLQLKVETAWLLRTGEDGPATSGFSSVLVGTKWRFLDEKTTGFSMSTYPQYEFHHLLSTKDPQLLTPGSRVILPIELKRSVGPVTLVGELGYQVFSHDFNEWLYGLIVSYLAVERTELLLEMHGTPRSDFSEGELLVNAGTRIALNRTLTLLVSAGRTLHEFEGDPARTFGFLGIKVSL